MKLKKCSKCSQEKSLESFQIRRASNDGLTASCKDCLSERDALRARLPHRVMARKIYSSTEAGRESHRKASRKSYLLNKDSHIESKNKWIEKNPKKRAVHGITGYAIKTGLLKKMPCTICGDAKSHAHHCDYDKPLDVIWLCALHHAEWHEENGPGLNGD